MSLVKMETSQSQLDVTNKFKLNYPEISVILYRRLLAELRIPVKVEHYRKPSNPLNLITISANLSLSDNFENIESHPVLLKSSGPQYVKQDRF